MAGRVGANGNCGYCGREMTARGLTHHLRSCVARRNAIEQADRGSRPVQDVFHLRVHGRYRPEYWLHLEMDGSATLDDLDYYLRRIWLECCEHLSQFNISGTLYDRPGDYQEFETMDVGVDRLFGVGATLTHQYDFGSTTELVIKVLDRRRGQPTTDDPIALMARNILRPPPCQACGKPAQFLCFDCHYNGSDESAGYLCEGHAAVHEDHEDYGTIPIVNSPRMGVCAYSGPAEPPW